MSRSRRVLIVAMATVIVATAAPPKVSAATTVVRIPIPADEGTLTPYTFQLAYPLVTLIYDTLYWRDIDGVPRPWLARSATVSPDGRDVTVVLANGVRWQDGEPLTADDVAFTFRYVASHPHPRFTPELSAVQSVSSPDASTIIIHLRQPSPGFTDQPLADLPILPAHLWGKLAASQTAPAGLPVGSGPYRLVDYTPGVGYRLDANADYFRGRPVVDTIDVPIVADASATLDAIRAGRVDVVPEPLPAPAEADLVGSATAIARGPSYLGTVLLFNLRQAPFDQPAVRVAISQALDLERIAASVGNAVPANRGLVHPASPWASTEPLHQADVSAARRQLAQIHLSPVDVSVADNDPVGIDAAQQVVLALQGVGVRASVRSMTIDALTSALSGSATTPPTFAMAITTTPPLASFDPDFLVHLFGSQHASAPLNTSGYQSAAFDQVATRVATSQDLTARHSATEEELRLLATDLPVVPLFFANGDFAYRPTAYRGWQFVKGTGIFDKLSFLSPSAPAVTNPASNGGGTDGGGLPLGWIAAILLTIAVSIALSTLVRSWIWRTG